MTQEELRAKFAPRKCSSQIEFDTLMQQINFEQTKMNHPLLDKERDFQNQFRNIDIQMSALRAQRNAVCIGYNNLHQEQKDINWLFYQIKQELYALNPHGLKNEEGTPSAQE